MALTLIRFILAASVIVTLLAVISAPALAAPAQDSSSIAAGEFSGNLNPFIQEQSFKVCGFRLVEAVKGVCKGNYFSGVTVNSGRRSRRSIVATCCRNSCTRSELAMYCGNSH